MNKYDFNYDGISNAIMNNVYVVVPKPKYDIDRCPYCNRKVNTDKLPIRYAVNEKNEIKPIIVVGNEYRVWGGIAGEEYKFGSIGDTCLAWIY